MPRMRALKPGFFTNENLAELPPLVRLLFAGLWTIADRAGRLEDRPKRIKGLLLPFDELDGDKALNQLANSQDHFIVRYQVNGKKYIQIRRFAVHQSPHVNEAPSVIPPPPVDNSLVEPPAHDKNGASTVLAPEQHGDNPPLALALTSKARSPHSPPQEPGGQAIGTGLVGESSQPPCSPLNGNGTVKLPRAEQPRLRKRKRVETLAQATKFELEHVVNERSTALAKALEHRPMSEGEALVYANTRWPTGPPNERVVALAFEAYAMRAGAAPGGTS